MKLLYPALVGLVATAAAAQPSPLPVQTDGVTVAERIYPVGWSSDGERIAYLSEYSEDGSGYVYRNLVVQDLVTDRELDRVELGVEDPEDGVADRSMGEIWASRRGLVRRTLREHGVQESDIEMRSIPAPGLPFVAVFETEETPREWGGQISASTLTLYEGGGRRNGGAEKVIDQQRYNEYGRLHGISAVGALVAPTGDRLAVVVEVVDSDFENYPEVVYRLVGAAVSPPGPQPPRLASPPALTGRRSVVVFRADEPKWGLGCGFTRFQGAVAAVEASEFDETSAVVTVSVDGPRSATLSLPAEIGSPGLSQADRDLFRKIAQPGRRVEVEVATCGSGGFEYLYRIEAL